MKKIVMVALLCMASVGKADGYPEDKYGWKESDKPLPPALMEKPKRVKLSENPAFDNPIILPPMVLGIPRKETPKNKPGLTKDVDISLVRPIKYWGSTGPFGGNTAYFGLRLEGGVFPYYFENENLSFNLGAGWVHISDRTLGPAPDYELDRAYARASITYWFSRGKWDLPFGIFHDRGINISTIENTYRRTGLTAGVFVGNLGAGIDIGINAVKSGFTPYEDPAISMFFQYRFLNHRKHKQLNSRK